MSVFLVLLLMLWITGSEAALLHLHVGKLLLDQSQPPTEARKFQTPVRALRWDEASEGVEQDQQSSNLHPVSLRKLKVNVSTMLFITILLLKVMQYWLSLTNMVLSKLKMVMNKKTLNSHMSYFMKIYTYILYLQYLSFRAFCGLNPPHS